MEVELKPSVNKNESKTLPECQGTLKNRHERRIQQGIGQG
jgi:hypothetical protein